ncbi:Transcription factor tau 55 kDa subunit [Colletotrichum orbiculare MAFF 240422]|uniref:Transcription factor tau 55 kDa subunit n=1 Tax=Colletotrichum orbiculare (strain 104-T / ATCC 96160 / CBS 514.97 / LARS 414 / MAFF 240422) TaxID=1213857 RepID=A0A484G161_COLOR|nr:Transcription factor tau 55 kDa subunit [Colletotrichum orbiculare MAFF 240422]
MDGSSGGWCCPRLRGLFTGRKKCDSDVSGFVPLQVAGQQQGASSREGSEALMTGGYLPAAANVLAKMQLSVQVDVGDTARYDVILVRPVPVILQEPVIDRVQDAVTIMSLEVIYITRHGFRSNWLVDPSTGSYTASIPSPTGIPVDPALTAHGVDQAKELGAHLLTVDPPIDAVYSSPYYRCLQTITPFVSLKEDQLKSLREKHVGPSSDATTIRPEHGLCECRVVPSRNGETIAQLHDRVAAAVEAIIAQCDAQGKRAVVLCSHAAAIIALGRVLTGVMPESIDAEDFRAFTCGLSVFRRIKPSSSARISGTDATGHGPAAEPTSWRNGRGVGGGWVCELNSDCSFLSGGEERGWRFSGDESFSTAQESSQVDAGVALGVVVEGEVRPDQGSPRRAAGHHRL